MLQKKDGRPCLITDTNILINFIKIGRLDILRKLQMYHFYIPEEVYEETSYPNQRIVLDQALKDGWIHKTLITDPSELQTYAKYKRQMGNGEAACLAISICRKWVMVCDEQKKKVISKEVFDILGTNYWLNTPGILLKAIKENILTVAQADTIKDALAQNRFVMNFASFQDLL